MRGPTLDVRISRLQTSGSDVYKRKKVTSKCKTHQRERDQARDEGSNDSRENGVTVHTATRRPTQNVRHDKRRDSQMKAVLKMIALPIALAYVVALVCFGNDQIMCLKNRRDGTSRGQSRRCDATGHRVDNRAGATRRDIAWTIALVRRDGTSRG